MAINHNNYKPLVSVIIPTFNRADVILTAINSVCKQSYENIEIIVIDDGSTDNTKDLLDSSDLPIKYYYQSNQGVSTARNKAISKSKGELIAFLDSDDTWRPEKLEKQVNLFKEIPEVALIHNGVIKINKSGEKSRILIFDTEKRYEIRDLISIVRNPYLGMSSIILKKEILDVTGIFDPLLKSAEDIDLFLRISEKYKVAFLNEDLVEVYINEKSLSAELISYEYNIKVINNFIEKHKNFIKDNLKLVNRKLSDLYLDYGDDLLWNKEYKKSLKMIKTSIKYKMTIKAVELLIKNIVNSKIVKMNVKK